MSDMRPIQPGVASHQSDSGPRTTATRPTCLLIAEVFPPKTGGSGRWLWELYRRFRPGAVVVAAGEAPGAAAFDPRQQLKIVRAPLSLRSWGMTSLAGLSDYWKAWRSVVGLLHAQGRDTIKEVHCSKCLPEGWLAWLIKKRYGIPYITFVHGEEANIASSSRELSWLMRRVLSSANLIIANSQNTASILRNNWQVPEAHIRVMHPGVDTTLFVPAPADAEVRGRLGWEGRAVLLTVGRLDRRKGHDRVIEVLPQLQAAIPNILYAIVGDGAERFRLEELARSLGVEHLVQFRGEPVDGDLLYCYQQCDLFVLANRQVGQDIEGFGIVLLEAQACEKPVIAGASGGTAETMNVDHSGYVIPCETTSALVELIPQLLRDQLRRERMGAAGRAWVVERLDWNPLVAQAKTIMQEAFQHPADTL